MVEFGPVGSEEKMDIKYNGRRPTTTMAGMTLSDEKRYLGPLGHMSKNKLDINKSLLKSNV